MVEYLKTHRSKKYIAIALVLALCICAACKTVPETLGSPRVENGQPVIRYLTAYDMSIKTEVEPLRGLEIRCMATDDDSDVLSYQWSVTGGQMQGEGNNISWIAPETTGEQTVSVTVTDESGNSTTGSIAINVTRKIMHYPVIHGVTCQNCTGGVQASRWKEYQIKCDASDLDNAELHYTWFSTAGEINGQGPYAVLRTSGQYGNALITVIVSDEQGHETEGYLALNISCCN